MSAPEYTVLGLMSGTSLDGLDIACCRFTATEAGWRYVLEAAETVPYPAAWEMRLRGLMRCNGEEVAAAHADYGHYLGRCVKAFIGRHALTPCLVASHGHTVFHQPAKGFTLQIGDGGAVAAECGLPVVSDFRVTDVALGGQGAPLVPIGDELLFPAYDACLNIGGICNLSFRYQGRRVAFDIAPANQVFNRLAAAVGKPFDRDGRIASQGQVDDTLLAALNALSYYAAPFPKSLGQEWVDAVLYPLVEKAVLSVSDKMATVLEHTAFQIAAVLREHSLCSLLLTGGGAKNSFLRQRIQALAPCTQQILPPVEVIDYKEALIFAFLGLLRYLGLPNCLSSVTGASRNSCCGALWEGGIC